MRGAASVSGRSAGGGAAKVSVAGSPGRSALTPRSVKPGSAALRLQRTSPAKAATSSGIELGRGAHRGRRRVGDEALRVRAVLVRAHGVLLRGEAGGIVRYRP